MPIKRALIAILALLPATPLLTTLHACGTKTAGVSSDSDAGMLEAGACASGAPGCSAGGDSEGPPSPESTPDAACPTCGDGRVLLQDGWSLQSSAALAEAGVPSGQDLSTRGASTSGWYPIRLPSTVLAGLVANHAMPDPYIGDNLKSIPTSIADGSWWYRTEFAPPADFAGSSIWLDLDGVNYKANVWLNGKLLASSDEVIGTFTAHEWDVTASVQAGQPNALAIEVFPPDLESDLTLTWRDWNPAPPDRDMGIWRNIYIKKSGPVAIRGSHVITQLEPSLATAHLTIKTDARNTTQTAQHATIAASVDDIQLTQDIDLAPGETKTVTFDHGAYPSLNIDRPRLWWPAQLGPQDRYILRTSARIGASVSDGESLPFGVRSVSFDLTPDGSRVFSINGHRILIRGGGWAPDMMLRPSDARLESELQYVRDMGLNTIRLEGKLETDEFFARADDYGILTIPGWMCCDRWQAWGSWGPLDHAIASASMDTQSKRLRNHPSVIDFQIGSDDAPPPDVENEFLAILKKNDWTNPISPSASDKTTPALGPSGVKMTGPYDWVAPAYWYLDTKAGGAFGFNTETGPGPAIPEIESVRAMLSQNELDDLWSNPNAAHLHAGSPDGQFASLALFNAALIARHGAATSLEDYVRKAQLVSYEAERAPFEAYGRNKYAPATGIVHWMLNNAWPSLIWHLYGYDLAPSAGYFGAKKGNEPIHIQYSYDDASVVVVNHAGHAASGMQATAAVYNLDASQIFSQTAAVAVDADDTAKVSALAIPPLPQASDTYFVKLTLTQAQTAQTAQTQGGQLLSSNFYWISKAGETIDFEHSDWYHTPTSRFADYTALAQLSPVALDVTVSSSMDAGEGTTNVTLENRTNAIAFFTRIVLTRGAGGDLVTPVRWEDNYVSLVPGEKRQLAAHYHGADLNGATPAIAIRGWNVSAK